MTNMWTVPEPIFHRYFVWGEYRLIIQWLSKKAPMGRFGGGWNWALGFKACNSGMVLNLLVFLIRFDWPRKTQTKTEVFEE